MPDWSKFWDADSLGFHNTMDMPGTTLGAPLMQEPFNPSLTFRRFDFEEARGIWGKLYIPGTTGNQLTSMTFRFDSRIRAGDDPANPVTPGNMHLWINFRTSPYSGWNTHVVTTAHPSPGNVHWQPFSIALNAVVVGGTLQTTEAKFLQWSIVRKSDDVLDTMNDGYWDVAGVNLEVEFGS